MRNPRQIRITLAVIAAVALAGYAIWTIAGGRRADGTVSASGTIEATEMDVSARVTGRIVRLLVDEGDTVKAGQVIAVLDQDDIRAQVKQARGSLVNATAKLQDLKNGTRAEQIRQARATLAQAEKAAGGARRSLAIAQQSLERSTELKAQLVSAQTSLTSARNAHKQAQARLRLVETGPRPEEIEQARAGVSQANAESKNAKDDAGRADRLWRQGAISKQQYDSAEARRDASSAALQAAKAKLAELEAGSRKEEKDEARAAEALAKTQVEGAQKTLATVQELYQDRLTARQQQQAYSTQYATATEQAAAARAQLDLLVNGPTAETLKAAGGQVEQAAGALEGASTQLGHTRIVAPADGVVTIKYREMGEYVNPGTPIVRIANLDRVWLRVYAPLPTLGRMKTGQSAEVTTDTYAGKTYAGRVASVSEEPEFTPKNVQTSEERVKLVYAVRIDIENHAHELKPGMPADAVIRAGTESQNRG